MKGGEAEARRATQQCCVLFCVRQCGNAGTDRLSRGKKEEELNVSFLVDEDSQLCIRTDFGALDHENKISYSSRRK